MTGDTHYDLEILAELAEGLLDAAMSDRVREHLTVCGPCGELLADLAEVRLVLAATTTPAMPMGVALRIDAALAAEAAAARPDLVAAPDWDELLRETPWKETPEPVRLGVVADDGTVVPARRRASSRRRNKWLMPAMAAAAAVAVIGSTVLALGPGGSKPPPPEFLAQPIQPTPSSALSFGIVESGYNYSEHSLKQPLVDYFGAYDMLETAADSGNAGVTACVARLTARTHLKPIAVDKSLYNGQEALVIASWKDQATNKVRVDVVDPFRCKAIRKPVVGRWK